MGFKSSDFAPRPSRKQVAELGAIRRGERGPVDAGRGEMRFTLPWPPQVNNCYTVARGRKILSTEARAYKVWARCLHVDANPFRGPVELELHFYRPTKQGDVSNRIKVVEDALSGVAFEDDCQVESLIAKRHEASSPELARVEVRVRSYAEGI